MSDPKPADETRAGDDLLAELADEFVRRHRSGEHPTVDEYATNYPELAQRIRELFLAMMAMEQPALNPTLDFAPPAERVGTTIGRYKLLERIGEGGFGVVYMAEQQFPVRRKVALKVIKPGIDTRQVIARFEAERQALALMEHENIAKVLDAGATDSGRPYFVMELVHGVPITDFCDRNQLPPRGRLELFVQVCRAVQHAHTKGIIHRDIKPTNVLVTLHEGVAVPKVIDFGVAKATGQQLTDKTLFTHFAQMVGTPLYMSPEQAEMTGIDVDTRSDVYSLGVLLYELLTGTTPVDKERLKQAAFDEVRRIIREEEPPRPSTRLSESKDSLPSISAQRQTEPAKLTKLVYGELDWIVMKALEKDRARRYETANGFASDVQRYLNDEAVLACPPSATYRASKILRRNKGPVAAFASLVLTLVGGIVGTSLGLRQAVHARNAEAWQRVVAQSNESKARDEAARADREAENARVEVAKQTAINHFLNEMLASANPQSLSAQDQVKGRDVTVLQVINDAVRRLNAHSLDNRPEIEAAVRRTIGKVYLDLGQYAEAESQLRTALSINQRVYGAEHPEVAKSLRDLARCLSNQAKRVDAEKMLHHALDMQRNLLGNENAEVATTLFELSRVVKDRGHQPEGRKLDGECLQIRRKVLPADHPDLALILRAVARGRKDSEGEAMLRETLAIQRKSLGPEHPEVAITMSYLASQLHARYEFEEAEKLHVQTLQLQRKLLGTEHPHVARTLISAALTAEARGKFVQADEFQKEALEIEKKTWGEDHVTVARTLDSIAASMQRRGKLAEAERLHRQAMATREHALGPAHGTVSSSLALLVGNLTQQGKLAEAEAECRRLIAVQRQHAVVPPSFPVLGAVLLAENKVVEAEQLYRGMLHNQKSTEEKDIQWWIINHISLELGGLLASQGRYVEAESLYRELLTLQRKRFRLDDANVVSTVTGLVRTLHALGNIPEEEKVLQEARDAFRDAQPDEVERPRSLERLATIYRAAERFAEAEACYREALAIRKKRLGEVQRDTDGSLRALAQFLHERHKLDESVVVWRQGIEVERKLSGDDQPFVANSYAELATVLQDAHQWAEAESALRRALSIRRKAAPEPVIANTLLQLGSVLCERGNAEEAEALIRECISIREGFSPPNKGSIANAKSHLGRALAQNGLREQAERLLLTAELDLREAPMQWDQIRSGNWQRLVGLYTMWGRADEAAKWRAKLTGLPATTAPQTRHPSSHPSSATTLPN